MPEKERQMKDLIEKYYNECIEIRHELHRYPETGHQETETTKRIRSYLEQLDLEILPYPFTSGIAAMIRGGKEGPLLAMREDIDALPMQEDTGLPYSSERKGFSHTCGHDIHASLLLLTARVLSECRNELAGDVLLIFQPAEETFDGAVTMIREGLFSEYQPQHLIGLHCSPSIPLGKTGVIAGTNNASCDLVEIEICGRGGHGAHPEECTDPIMAAAVLLNQLQTLISREISPQKSAVLTFGQLEAGTAPNIIPDKAVLYGTFRTLDDGVRDYLKEAIPRMANQCCASMRASCTVTFSKGMPVLVNEPKAAKWFAEASETALGMDSVVWLSGPSMGSDDFSCLLKQCYNSGGQFLIGTRDPEIPESGLGLHKTKNIFPDEAVKYGASVLCQYAAEWLKRDNVKEVTIYE